MKENTHKWYRVRWETDEYASSPQHAAKLARADQRRRGSIATVFTVSPKDDNFASEETTVDLSEETL
jgi:hypothetical protein